VDPREVAEMRWFTLKAYERDIKVNPQNHTLGTVNVWNEFRDTLLTI